MPPVVFRSTFNRVLSIVAWAAIGAVIVGTVMVPGALSAAPGIVPGAAGAAALVWALLWAPFVAVDDEGATVGNVFVEHRVPWPALVHVETQYSLTLHTPGRRIRATAAPAPGSIAGMRAARAHRRTAADATSGLRPGDLPNTDSGDAAELVRVRWHRLRDAGLIEAGVADTTPVGMRVRVPAVIAVTFAVAALIAAALLV